MSNQGSAGSRPAPPSTPEPGSVAARHSEQAFVRPVRMHAAADMRRLVNPPALASNDLPAEIKVIASDVAGCIVEDAALSRTLWLDRSNMKRYQPVEALAGILSSEQNGAQV